MKFFYLGISRNPSEVSEVHVNDCPQIPPMLYRSYLGPFNNANEALRKARERKKNVVPCSECCENIVATVAFSMPAECDEN